MLYIKGGCLFTFLINWLFIYLHLIGQTNHQLQRKSNKKVIATIWSTVSLSSSLTEWDTVSQSPSAYCPCRFKSNVGFVKYSHLHITPAQFVHAKQNVTILMENVFKNAYIILFQKSLHCLFHHVWPYNLATHKPNN